MKEDSRAAAGSVAEGVSAELARPLREVREILATALEKLDRHISEAEGPQALSWDETRQLREELANAYMMSRTATRLASDFAAASSRSTATEACDLNRLVETAINLSRHCISAESELFVDLGAVPAIKAIPGLLTLVVSRLIMLAADSARGVDGAAISIKTRRESNEIVLYVADNGSGLSHLIDGPRALAIEVASSLGGSFEGTSESGSGSVFELRLPIRR